LNAREGHEIAHQLARQGLAAVGMLYQLRSDAAAHFCRGLYGPLTSGAALDEAVNRARYAIRLECGGDRRDWFAPVTVLPGGVARPLEMVKGSIGSVAAPSVEKEALPTIRGYEVIEQIGAGAMGTVYKARQVALDRTVALKVLPPELARDRAYVSRFEREAKLAARISHPNVIQVHDVGEDRGLRYIAMEFVPGSSVEEQLALGPLPERRALEITRDVARALAVAHERGIVHRDIKPSNIIVADDGTPKLADLGLARDVSGASGSTTKDGTVVGTPHYMSPEQCRGDRDLDGRSDIYSLGATLFHMVCGRTPYEGDSSVAVMMKHVNEPLPDPRAYNPSLSESTANLIRRMMAKDRARRFRTCEECAAASDVALSAIVEEPPMLETVTPLERAEAPTVIVPPARAPNEDVGGAASPPVVPHARPVPGRAGPGRVRRFGTLALAAGACAMLLVALVVAARLASPTRPEPATPDVEQGSSPPPASPPPVAHDMVTVPGGNLFKGSWDDSVTVGLLRKYGPGAGSALAELCETGERVVTLAPFYIDAREVTNAEYAKFLEEAGKNRAYSHPDEPPGKDHTPKLMDAPGFNGPDQPVVGLDWFDAYAYAAWAGKRLPTEDEWELAARGTDGRPYPWGTGYENALYAAQGPAQGRPRAVSALAPERPGGPVAMAGNVSEWTASPHPEQAGLMICRGGAFATPRSASAAPGTPPDQFHPE